jgi:hypothetical protein
MSLSRQVIAFALLHEYSDKIKSDLIGGISLLINPIAIDLAGQVFSPDILSKKLAENYGVSVPAAALHGFIPNLIKFGILEENPQANGIAQIIYRFQENVSVHPSMKEAQFQEVINDFLAHSKTQLKLSNIKIKDDDLISGFLQHLCTQDFSSIKARPTIDANPTSTIVGESTKEKQALSDELEERAAIDGVIASYISHLYIHDIERLKLLAKVADGAIGAELVLDLQAPKSVTKFTDTTAVIDTPILMSYLDLSSSQEQASAKELLALLKEAGIKIAAFQHSIAEAEGVLKAIQAARVHGTAYGRTIHRLINPAYRAYFDSMLGRVGNVWHSKNTFEIIQETATHYYVNFSQADEENLISRIHINLEDRISTSERDAKSVAEIIRRLGGAHVPIDNISSCRFMFVTSNASFQRRAANFLRERDFVNKNEFMPVVTDRYISGLCWIMAGGRSENSPSIARLLANCAAALRLRPELADRTKKLLSYIDAEKAEHFEALMTSERASNYLMEVTFGNPAVLTASNAEEIFEEVQRRAVEKVTLEKDKFYKEKLSEISKDFESVKADKENLLSEFESIDKKAKETEQAATIFKEKSEVLAVEKEGLSKDITVKEQKLKDLNEQMVMLALDRDRFQLEFDAQRTKLINDAKSFARLAMFFCKVIGAILLFCAAGGLGFIDKFWIPKLSVEDQATANIVLIAFQSILGLLGLSLFTRYFSKFSEGMSHKIYLFRLSKFLSNPEEIIKKYPLNLK